MGYWFIIMWLKYMVCTDVKILRQTAYDPPRMLFSSSLLLNRGLYPVH